MTGASSCEDQCAAVKNGRYSGAVLTTETTLNDYICEDCQVGQSTNGGTAQCSCTECAAGKYAAVKASSECTSCEPGKYILSISTCNMCVAGKYSPATGASVSTCIDCEAGKYVATTGNTAASSCMNCDKNTGNWFRERVRRCPESTGKDAGV